MLQLLAAVVVFTYSVHIKWGGGAAFPLSGIVGGALGEDAWARHGLMARGAVGQARLKSPAARASESMASAEAQATKTRARGREAYIRLGSGGGRGRRLRAGGRVNGAGKWGGRGGGDECGGCGLHVCMVGGCGEGGRVFLSTRAAGVHVREQPWRGKMWAVVYSIRLRACAQKAPARCGCCQGRPGRGERGWASRQTAVQGGRGRGYTSGGGERGGKAVG